MEIHSVGKALVIIGLCVVIIGIVVLVVHKIPGIGKLPGDIVIKKDNFTFYFPLATSLIVSAILSLVLWFFSKR